MFLVAIEVDETIVEQLHSHHDLEKTIDLAAQKIHGKPQMQAHIRGDGRYLANLSTNIYGDVTVEKEEKFIPRDAVTPYDTSIQAEPYQWVGK